MRSLSTWEDSKKKGLSGTKQLAEHVCGKPQELHIRHQVVLLRDPNARMAHLHPREFRGYHRLRREGLVIAPKVLEAHIHHAVSLAPFPPVAGHGGGGGPAAAPVWSKCAAFPARQLLKARRESAAAHGCARAP